MQHGVSLDGVCEIYFNKNGVILYHLNLLSISSVSQPINVL